MKLGPLQIKWVNSLKKHPERQMNSTLGRKFEDGTYKACCLGEAGLIIGSCSFNKNGALTETKSCDSAVLFNSYKKIGLKSANGSFEGKDEGCLAALNDDTYHTWTDIAYLIEAAPELFFTKSV